MKRVTTILVAAAVTLLCFGTRHVISQSPKGKDLDRQHDEIIKDFVTRTHRLALQYQAAGSHDKAKDTLDLILKVSPDDAQAKALLDKIAKQELTENKKVLKVLANQGWQKTGVSVLAGKPVSIEAKGEWIFKMNRPVGPEGIEMPDDMKKFPLGSLIGAIDAEGPVPKKDGKKERESNRPFLIGSQTVFDAPATGMLYLKMHDSEESDNAGQLTVTISGQIRER